MFYTWLLLALLVVDIIVSVTALVKLIKQEIVQTGEAHANLELINQSLNRLSDIAEQLESKRPANRTFKTVRHNGDNVRPRADKKNQALTLIKRGENPQAISRKLGISRSEIDLLMASEKLGNSKLTNRLSAAGQV